MTCKHTASLLVTFLCISATAFGIPWDGDIYLTGGYRSDCLETALTILDLNEETLFTDTIKGKNIDVYQIGVKGKASICNQYFVRGYAIFGTIADDGKYHEKEADPQGNSAEIEAKITDGYTADYSIGAGYLFPLARCLSIGPSIGYAYVRESITMDDAEFEGEELSILNDLVYKMRWQGPWLGADAVYTIGCFDLHLGYEYHWCDWRAEWLLDGPDIPQEAFSDERKSSDAYGNVFFVDANYRFCRCWNIGLEFKYQYWKVDSGRVEPKNSTYEQLGFDNISKTKVNRADLVTYGIQVSIGRHF